MAVITSRYGMRKDPKTGLPAMHHGIDFATPVGTPIYATRPVRVVQNRSEGGGYAGYGHYLTVEDIQTGQQYRMAHLESPPKLKVGQEIRPGELLAFTGNSGKSTGAHLHYEVIIDGKKVDPEKHKENTPVSFNKEPGSTVFTAAAVASPNRANATYPNSEAQQRPPNDPNYKPGNQSAPRPSNDPLGDFARKKTEEDARRRQQQQDAQGQAGRTNRENNARPGRRALERTTESPFHRGHDGSWKPGEQ